MKLKIFILCSLFYFKLANAQCWKSISSGGNQSLVIDLNNNIWGWGSNSFGTLGLGFNSGNQLNPIQSANLSSFTQVDVGGNEFAIALKTDGTLWSAGLNDYGQLGIGNLLNKNSFTQIGLEANWQSISVGGLHTLALKTDGSLWSWGSNSEGQLGDNTITDATAPIQIENETNWAKISAGGYYFSVGIKTNGTLWTWGNDSYQQLGNGFNLSHQLTPTQIGTEVNWKEVSAGQYHTLGIKTDGTLWAWGNNGTGALGDGTTISKSEPVQIGIANDWDKIVASNFTSYAIKTNGTLWSWGYNSNGQLGDGTIIDKLIPTQIGLDSNWKEISSKGSYYALALKTDGSAWSWGINFSGNLGDGTTNQRLIPTEINCPTSLNLNKFDSQQFSIYPNPSKGVFKIDHLKNINKIQAFDVLGKEIQVNSNVYGEYSIEKSGLYYLKIVFENEKIKNSKIIIE